MVRISGAGYNADVWWGKEGPETSEDVVVHGNLSANQIEVN